MHKSQVGNNESVGDFANEIVDEIIELGVTGVIHLPPGVRNVVFQVTSLMLHFLQMKGLFGGQAVSDANRHLRNFVDICLPFMIRNISQESIRLRLFPLSLTVDATSLLTEFPQGSSTSWDELKVAFLRDFSHLHGYRY